MAIKIRFYLTALISALMALYCAVFAQRSMFFENDLTAGIFSITWLAWLPVLAFTVGAGLAGIKNGRFAAVALILAILCFFVAHWRLLFQVPLGFLLVCGATLAALFLMPPEERLWR